MSSIHRPQDNEKSKAGGRELRRDPAKTRRIGLGAALLVFAALILLVFVLGVPAGVKVTYRLNAQPAFSIPELHLPVLATNLVLGILAAGLGVAQLLWKKNRHPYMFFTFGMIFLAFSFISWAGKGQAVDLEGLLTASLIQAVPLTLGAMSGLLCERSGVINIAIEGQFLVAAFFGAVIGSATGALWLGLVSGAIAGGLIGVVLAIFTITYLADQIIVGVVLDAFALGLTTFFLQGLLVPNQLTLNSPEVFQSVAIPLVSKIPIIGPLLFNQNIFVYLTILILIAVQLGLFHTRWGLRVRAVGENPKAAETVGIDVIRVRYRNVILGGVVAGIGGASFTIGSTGQFASNMTSGLGYIALAAMIFGRWRPLGALGAALLFGFADALQFTLSVLNVPIPSDILSMFPYLATIFAVAGLVGRVVPPAADGQAYVRE
ncbi:ABC transporter permease [Salinispira pacifica]